jgi:hypothetical protein
LKVMKEELLRPTFALLKPLCSPPILICIQQFYLISLTL